MTELTPVLAGTRILVTAQRRSDELAAALSRRGAEVVVAPAIGVVPDIDVDELLRRTREILSTPVDVVVVTTGIGFRGWMDTAEEAGLYENLVANLEETRLVARGPKARGALQAAGLQADWVAESETSAEIREWMLAEGVAGAKVAVQHHGAGADGLDEALEGAGAQVRSLVVYRWGPPRDPDLLLQSVHACVAGEIDAVVFTSAPGAHAWLQVARSAGLLDRLVQACSDGGLVAAAVGPVTAKPLLDAGIAPLVPERGRLGALVRALVVRFGAEDTAVETPAGRLQLRRSAAVLDGRVLPLSPSGLAVLRMLADNPGAVVPRAA